jgi:hypothetical protein
MTPSSPLHIAVIGAKPGTMVEIKPGKTYVSLTPESVDVIAVPEMVPAGDGTFRAVARICPRRFTISRKNLKRLGIAISDTGLIRLVRAGFVAGEKVTPGITQFDFLDYLRHQKAVADDPEFWDRTEPGERFSNRERYRQAL